MGTNETKRIKPSIQQQDRDALAALKTMTGYAPGNTECTLAKVEAAETAMNTVQEVEVQKKAESDAARDAACAGEWAFHNIILLAKDAVKGQFGPDSDQVQALGMKKKSERKKPTTKKTTTPPTP